MNPGISKAQSIPTYNEVLRDKRQTWDISEEGCCDICTLTSIQSTLQVEKALFTLEKAFSQQYLF